jgi:hypothetical protein
MVYIHKCANLTVLIKIFLVSLESDFDNDAALAGKILLLSEKMQKITTKTSETLH